MREAKIGSHYTILGLGNVDCSGGLRVGTGILCSCCRHHATIVLKSLQSALLSQKWNGPIPCSQHSYTGTCPFEEVGGGGGVAGSDSFRSLINTGSDLVQLELPLASGPRVQSMISRKSHKALSFSRYLVPAIFLTILGKDLR